MGMEGVKLGGESTEEKIGNKWAESDNSKELEINKIFWNDVKLKIINDESFIWENW